MKNYKFKWAKRDVFYMLLYLNFLLIIAINSPKSTIIYHEQRVAMVSLGVIGIWRYGWWLNHVIRAFIYGRLIFPLRRKKANALWDSGWRPSRLFFMMTTFHELQATTELVLKSIIDESNLLGIPIKLFIGTGTESDELIINHFFSQQKLPALFEVIMVRQKLPGKRYAIGETLRAMVKHNLEKNDPVVFMDGDTYFEPGCLSLCLPFFNLFPNLQALTTYEKCIVKSGPTWVKKWLAMRFAQRDFTMQSYSLSNKVLTLTGRMSIFRGLHLLNPEFINIIENDHLKHWLWGDYRFLSGDDKSTWYFLLKMSAEMIYIPDATTITIEYIEGSALDRMQENLKRWSGNTLRNGARAIALGPQRVGYFIWWCLIDQRCAIWTMFIGHTSILIIALTKNTSLLLISFLWIAFSRFCMSLVLFFYARRIDMTFPILIYINQFMSTVIKIYILFRLPQQRWKNRGNQQVGFEGLRKRRLQGYTATYLTAFYCLGCFLAISLVLGLVSLPTKGDFITLW